MIIGGAAIGVAGLVYWLRNQGSRDQELRDNADKVAKKRSQNPSRRMRTPPPPTPDLVSIQQLWRAHSNDDSEDPDTAVSSPGDLRLPSDFDELAEPPTFPSQPGMKAFLEEELASLPPRKRSKRPGAPYPEAMGPADDFVKATQGVIRRTDSPRDKGESAD